MFNLYFAGWGHKSADKYLMDTSEHRLFSFANERKQIDNWCINNKQSTLFIDSGAFSVAHSGLNINIDEYINFINSNPNVPIFVELDVIPYPNLDTQIAKICSDKSWENYLYMRERITVDCNLLPVYHFGEPTEGLVRILNTKIDGKFIDYISIGGRHGVSTDKQIRYFNEIFSVIQRSNNPNVKVHGLGISTPQILESFPFYSADSTTWLQLAISGSIVLPDMTVVCMSDRVAADRMNFNFMPTEAKVKVLNEIETMGYDVNSIIKDYTQRLLYNIDSFKKWAKNYTYKGKTKFISARLF